MMPGDPLEKEIELPLRSVEFISDCACFSLAGGSEEAAAKIEGLTGTTSSISLTSSGAILPALKRPFTGRSYEQQFQRVVDATDDRSCGVRESSG
jgi:hypothetical protein